MKSVTTSFRHIMSGYEVRGTKKRSDQCDLCIAIGPSLDVCFATYMPIYSTQSCFAPVIIHRDPMAMDTETWIISNITTIEAIVSMPKYVKT